MIGILTDISPIAKEQRNTAQGYQFRGIDQFLNALHPLMAKHGVYVTPSVESIERTERQGKSSVLLYAIATVRFTFRAADGSSVDCVTVGEGMDSGDKATNKAMSAAYKYALMQTFAVPTEDMIDGDAESPEVTYSERKSSGKFDRKANFGLLTDYLAENGIEATDAERYCVSIKYLEDGERLSKLTDARLSKICGNLSRFGNAIVDYRIADNPQDDGGTDE
jgi:hypothetical protein